MSQEKPAQDESSENVIILEKITKKNGEVIHKKYLRGKVLGKGGFATCYEVTDLEKNRVMAAKIVAKASLTKKRALEKLLAEIKIHKALQHENIVNFEHVFEDKENVYILLELCPNQTLKELVKKHKRLNEVDCATYLYQTIQALKHLHLKKIIHRDLKLGNLLLGKSMEIKVADFGLAAKIEQEGERRKTICGTPNYIAPEVLDKKIGHSYEVDVWSMGVICYTLLIGRPPFETNDTKTTYRKILKASYAFPSNIPISENARDLIKKILVIEPSRRPTWDEILEHPFVKNNYTRTLSLPTIELSSSSKKGLSLLQANLSPGNVAFIQTPQGMNRLGSPDRDIDENDIYQSSLKKNDKALSMNRLRVNDMKQDQYGMTSGSPRTIGGLNDKIELQVKPDYEFYISKWVDYTTKYGLGYLLSDGTVGVVFKDHTRITLAPDGIKFEYMKRMSEQSKEVLITCHIKDYPKELEKKVLLLNHFKNYLEGNKTEGDEVIDSNQNFASEQIKQMPLVYLKKWIKTKYAFIFRLSNRIVQIDFNDKTRVILSSVNQVVCYKNKKGELSQYNLETALNSENTEMVKRLNYAKEILTFFKTHTEKKESNFAKYAKAHFDDGENKSPMIEKDFIADKTPSSNLMGGKSRVLEVDTGNKDIV